MSPPGRHGPRRGPSGPLGEYRSAKHEGTPVNVLYVYYKVPVALHDDLVPQVRSFQASLVERHPGLACELLQRPAATDAVETWMETYRHATALTDAMIASIAGAAEAAALPAPRHAEVFVPLN